MSCNMGPIPLMATHKDNLKYLPGVTLWDVKNVNEESLANMRMLAASKRLAEQLNEALDRWSLRLANDYEDEQALDRYRAALLAAGYTD